MATRLRTLSVLCSPLLAPALPEPLDWLVALRGGTNYGTASPWHNRPYGRHGLSSTDNCTCMRSCHRLLPAMPRCASCCREYLSSCFIPVPYAPRPWHVTLPRMPISPLYCRRPFAYPRARFPQQHGLGGGLTEAHRGARASRRQPCGRGCGTANTSRGRGAGEEKTYGRPQDYRP